ncbi:MAG: protein translocase subunit SecF [Gammaproteobacteria bacterium]|nr:protein translocase subunit SecF [Gammaproteobacteria bacterium]NNF61644.1 protein translocase subunit SecF [Gammaproteobacteria bacterium]NNM20550.1 protein translocase subunit SecF [Gammaproteobacteria bacterium]
MQLIGKTTHIDFMGHRRLAVTVSVLLLAGAIAALVVRGLAFGIDFTGGVLVEVGYPQDANLQAVRGQLSDGGFDDAIVQHFGTSRDVMIRLMPVEGMDGNEVREQILQALRSDGSDLELRRVEFVGPQVGQELTETGVLAMLVAIIMILIYVALRFQWKFAVGAVAALVHDVVLTVGFFAVLQLSFDLSVLAAVLAVIGYSLNDTIVVFDRIRENMLKVRGGAPVDIVNDSINQMLARTLITGITTLLVLLALFFLGGEVIRPFSIALIVGVIVGTYSSIYVASATALALDVTVQDLLPPEKTDEELDALP